MDKIHIKKNPNGDTRTAPKGITFQQFEEANDSHRHDVKQVMHELSRALDLQGMTHDWTKKSYGVSFYQDFTDTINNGVNFTELPWYQKHVAFEKHHPFSNLHDDYNLLDLIETIVDCVCAGMTRSGDVRPMEFDDKIIKLAVDNTVKLIKDMIIVEE